MLSILNSLLVLGSSSWFEDVSDAVGVNVNHHATYLITGQAFADIDRDGWVDIILTSNDGQNTILMNQQGVEFEVAPFSQDIVMPGHQSGGLAVADYDNDGWPDIYLAGNGSNHLFRNNHGQGFSDVTELTGTGHNGRDESAAWADFNNDGWLDLIVVGFPVVGHPDLFAPVNLDALFFANGDGAFTNMSSMLDSNITRGPGFTVGIFDYDHDGDQDIYVVNDKLWGNSMWRNDGAGCGGWCFVDVADTTNTRRPVYGMGIAVADYDNDLDDDLLFSSIGEQVLLASQWSQGQSEYLEVSNLAGISVNAIGWATLFFDMDNDSWQDAFIATYNDSEDDSDRVYKNQQDGTFLDISAVSGASHPSPSIGAAYGDYNRDGKLDLLVGDHGNGFRLLKNVSSDNNHWLSLKLDGGHSVNRDAIGTKLRVTRADETSTLYHMFSGDAIGSGSEGLIHIGLGSNISADVHIEWTDGTEQMLIGLQPDQRHLIVHPDSELISTLGFEN